MKKLNVYRVAPFVGTLLLGVAAACGDSKNPDTSTDGTKPATTASSAPNADPSTTPTSTDPTRPSPTGDGEAAASLPTLPGVLSVGGCEALGVGPLCSLTQTGKDLRVNCGGRTFTGDVTTSGTVTLTSTSTASASTEPVACTGRFVGGQVKASCSQAVDGGAAKTCNLVSDRQILPGVTCLELPPTLKDVALCSDAATQGGTPIVAGTCKVLQDGCNFQAECENDVLLSGTVSRTGVSFTQRLVALADAQTPAAGGAPAFKKGDTVAHACTGSLSGTSLTGSCSAGAAGRGGVATSVCAIAGAATSTPEVCAPIAPASEHLFALDSCELLRDGENGQPGIGQPVCAFRQNNCIWDVNCGNDPLKSFSGRLKPGAKGFDWRLLTGTPCEASFDATGNFKGTCTVPGQAACELKSIPAVPGDATACPDVPFEETFTSRGCGATIACRVALQHKCEFMAACSFTTRYPDVIIAGRSSFDSGRSHLAFNGLNGYQCAVDEATSSEITSGDRKSGEWYGQCENAAGGVCRDNYNPTTGAGFRGLQVFFGAPQADAGP